MLRATLNISRCLHRTRVCRRATRCHSFMVALCAPGTVPRHRCRARLRAHLYAPPFAPLPRLCAQRILPYARALPLASAAFRALLARRCLCLPALHLRAAGARSCARLLPPRLLAHLFAHLTTLPFTHTFTPAMHLHTTRRPRFPTTTHSSLTTVHHTPATSTCTPTHHHLPHTAHHYLPHLHVALPYPTFHATSHTLLFTHTGLHPSTCTAHTLPHTGFKQTAV